MTIERLLADKSNMVGKIKLVELLERSAPYRSSQERFDQRLSRAISTLPPEWHEPALALFSATLYVPTQVMQAAWRSLWLQLSHARDLSSPVDGPAIFELDRDALRDNFYRAVSAPGRLHDNSPLRSASDILDSLAAVHSGELVPEYEEALAELSSRKEWILLADVSLTGTSLLSEVERLASVGRILSPESPPRVTCLVQVMSDVASTKLRNAQVDVRNAISLPMNCALNSPEFNLIADDSLVGDVREFCRWFARTYVEGSKHPLAKAALEARDPIIAEYGYGGLGWTLVTTFNTPNNSAPPMWFQAPEQTYRPPFARVDSRAARRAWSGRKEWERRLAIDEDLQVVLSSALARTAARRRA